MRRRTKLSINPKHIYIVCGVICIVLIIVSFKFDKEMAPVKTATGSVFTPMQKGINKIGSAITNKMDLFKDKKDILNENEKLKEKVSMLEGENRLLSQDKDELEELRKLYAVEDDYSKLPRTAARIISKDPTNWYTSFTIDKGKDDGIEVNMNVVSDEGLVGIICETGKNYSKVRSITDDKSNVTAVFKKSSEICNVAGDLTSISEGNIKIDSISKDVEVKNGDAVYTAYDSTKFHSGILIGYVSDVEVDSNNVTKSGKITPAVNFEELKTVLIIKELSEGLKD